MTIKKIKPVSNSRRNTVLIDYKKTLVVNRKKKRIRSLFKIVKKKSGRNNQGRITIRHKGGQKKRFYRLISFGPHGKKKTVTVQLKSKEIRKINENCMATIGKIGNSECSSVKLGKSGRKR